MYLIVYVFIAFCGVRFFQFKYKKQRLH